MYGGGVWLFLFLKAGKKEQILPTIGRDLKKIESFQMEGLLFKRKCIPRLEYYGTMIALSLLKIAV